MLDGMQDWEQQLADEDTSVYPIGVVADLLDADVQAIRRYDDAGIVQPERSDSGQRRYSRRDIARLAHALHLAGEGVTMPGIRRILELEKEVANLQDQLGDDAS